MRSTGSSDSTVAVSRIVATSTKTWPRRGARTASAAASAIVSSVSPVIAREADRDVDVGRRQHADVIERAQQPGRVAGAADVVRVVFGERAHALPRSRTSLRATTSGAGGRQANTPHGVPSTVGVVGPVIPRTNR